MHRWIPTARCAMTALAAAAPRVRRVVPLALALALVAGVTQPAVRGATTMGWGVDHDRDGIDDGVEQWAAEYFMPNLRYHSAEDCGGPWYNPVLYRVRQLSVGGVVFPGWAAINYVRLYEKDCGSPRHSWFPSHDNDNEPFLVIVRYLEGEWRTAQLLASNHEGTPWKTPTSTRFSPPLRPWQGRPDLYVSLHKHANYTNLRACNKGGVSWPDWCEPSVFDSSEWPTHDYWDPDWNGGRIPDNLRQHMLINTGEPRASLMPAGRLGMAFHMPWPWGRGWLFHDPWSGRNLPGAGVISDGLYLSSFKDAIQPREADISMLDHLVTQCHLQARARHDQDPTLALQGIDLYTDCDNTFANPRWDP